MNDRPLISVVLPVYNVGQYIKECMDSILSQSFQDFEIIVIDDCSTDDTVKLIETYKDSRIFIKKKNRNKGLIDSLNLGFELARGKYIARMDGDDISTPDRFQKQFDILENNSEIDVCGCWLQQFGQKHETIKHKKNHEEIVVQMLLSCSMSMGSVMFNRETLGIFRFDKTKKHVEDYDFWSRAAWTCKFYNIQKVLYYYRMHETQVSSIHKKIQIEGDIPIKLSLFKKLDYNTIKYSDELISKMLLLNKPLSINDLGLFVKWLKELTLLNNKNNVFLQHEFENILKSIQRTLLFSLYFEKTSIGITKGWRIKALFKLPIKDVMWILNLKRSELRKTIFKA